MNRFLRRFWHWLISLLLEIGAVALGVVFYLGLQTISWWTATDSGRALAWGTAWGIIVGIVLIIMGVVCMIDSEMEPVFWLGLVMAFIGIVIACYSRSFFEVYPLGTWYWHRVIAIVGMVILMIAVLRSEMFDHSSAYGARYDSDAHLEAWKILWVTGAIVLVVVAILGLIPMGIAAITT